MFCINCGTQLPEDSNFCLKCGKAQKAGVQADEPKYETCEIVWYLDKSNNSFIPKIKFKMYFWAHAIGTKGVYCADKSSEFSSFAPYPESGNENQVAVLNQFINKLVSNGWQSLTRGQEWYSYRFQRKV